MRIFDGKNVELAVAIHPVNVEIREPDNLCDDECQPTWVHLTAEIGETQQL